MDRSVETAPDSMDLTPRFEALRAREFSRLDEMGQVYLDYTGSGLYADSHLQAHEDFLEHHVLGNPHSENPASSAATRVVEEARREILEFFGADSGEFSVVFTSNASGALKLVGESFPFEPGSRFTLLEDNHNSVNGIRQYAEGRGAETIYLPLTGELRRDPAVEIPPAGSSPGLFAFPAQSNFSGVRHPLALVEEARDRGYHVLLDTAAYVPTSPVVLDEVRPDFACVSFYKMFGFPTGIGALIARKEALARLRRPWFAGGTVEFVSVASRRHRLVPDAVGFEDGTLNFLGIAGVRSGLGFLRDVGMDRVRRRVHHLTTRLLEVLMEARYPGNEPAVRVYGPTNAEGRGGTVAFNLLDRQGLPLPYGEVERAASRVGISLRGGCFCNPGAAERALELPSERMLECLETLPPGSFSLRRMAECLGGGIAVGALRASVSVPTVEADLDRLATFLGEFLDS
ncbi:MAG: aminotransferase class V-fold PLP-dependent enzyme [Gemmatimonadota bacterium]